MNEENEKSGIEALQQKIYSRQHESQGGVAEERHKLSAVDDHVPREWEHEQEAVKPSGLAKLDTYVGSTSRNITMKILVWGSVLFFFVAAVLAGYFLFDGTNTISTENVNISVSGPVLVDGGDEIALQIAITNNNTTALEFSDLIIEFPEGTHNADNMSVEMPRLRESIGVINAGASIQQIKRAILFGEENSVKNIKVTLEYRVEGSNAIYVKEKDFKVTIGVAPVGLKVVSVKEVSSKTDVELTLDVTSNSSAIVSDVLVVADYPFGFTFKRSNPPPSFGNNAWRVGDMKPNTKRQIVVTGELNGVTGDKRVFRFANGIQNADDLRTFSTPFTTALQEITITKPFLDVELALNGTAGDEFYINSAKDISAVVKWKNNLPVRISDAELEVKFKGDILDKRKVKVGNGFFRSIDNTILWNKFTDDSLSFISAGEAGQFTFSFTTIGLGSSDLMFFSNPELYLDVSFRGTRSEEVDVPEHLNSTESVVVKVNSDPRLTARLTHFVGPFVNSGSIPPKVDKETSYTATFSLINTTNSLSKVRMVASLPPYVRWLGITSPQSEDVRYDERNKLVIWNVGNLAEKRGLNNSPREMSFQVVYLASVSQLGQTPVIVRNIGFSGTDNFTGYQYDILQSDLTTQIFTDPQYTDKMDSVIP